MLRYPLLDWLRVISRWTGRSCCVHSTAWWIFRLHSDTAQRGSALWVWCFQGLLQTGSNVSEKCLLNSRWEKVKETIKIIFFLFVSYKKGGVATGMRHTETNTYDVKRLLHVKGKKRVIAKEVSPASQGWYNIMGQRMFFRKRALFYCVSGGDELGELQPWRRVSVRYWQDHNSVERAQE